MATRTVQIRKKKKNRLQKPPDLDPSLGEQKTKLGLGANKKRREVEKKKKKGRSDKGEEYWAWGVCCYLAASKRQI